MVQLLKRELNTQEMALMTIEPAMAHPKLSMENPLTTAAANCRRTALMMSRKRPSVTMMKGIEKKNKHRAYNSIDKAEHQCNKNRCAKALYVDAVKYVRGSIDRNGVDQPLYQNVHGRPFCGFCCSLSYRVKCNQFSSAISNQQSANGQLSTDIKLLKCLIECFASKDGNGEIEQ